MECCMDNATKEQKRVHKEIEKQLKEDRKNAYKEIKFLLLGDRRSGKSTFVKQMRIIYGIGYSDEDKKNFIKLIYQDIFKAMQIMIQNLEYHKIEYKESSNHKNADLICSIDLETVTSIENQFANAMKALWNDPSIQECYHQKREHDLSDSAKYFLNDLDRIACSDYLPSQEDILRVQVPTSNITEYVFDLDSYIFKMIEVACFHTTNRKFKSWFQDMTSFIFFVALSEYDEMLYDDKPMTESKIFFHSFITSPWFRYSPIVLFLNKKDLFEEKIMVSHLVDYFPEYDGPKQDCIAAREFILKMYLSESAETGRIIYPHFTCAIDTENIRSVFASVKDTILQENLRNFRLESCLV